MVSPGHDHARAGCAGEARRIAVHACPRRAEHHAPLDAERVGQRQPCLLEFGAEDHGAGPGVLDDAAQFIRRQAPVETDHDHAELAASVEQFHVFGRAVGEHGDALTGFEAPLIAQEFGTAAGLLVQLGVADLAPGKQIHQRRLVGKLLRLLDQPVGYEHFVLLVFAIRVVAEIAQECIDALHRGRLHDQLEKMPALGFQVCRQLGEVAP